MSPITLKVTKGNNIYTIEVVVLSIGEDKRKENNIPATIIYFPISLTLRAKKSTKNSSTNSTC